MKPITAAAALASALAGEFDAKNRPEGWNVWMTLAFPLGSTKP